MNTAADQSKPNSKLCVFNIFQRNNYPRGYKFTSAYRNTSLRSENVISYLRYPYKSEEADHYNIANCDKTVNLIQEAFAYLNNCFPPELNINYEPNGHQLIGNTLPKRLVYNFKLRFGWHSYYTLYYTVYEGDQIYEYNGIKYENKQLNSKIGSKEIDLSFEIKPNDSYERTIRIQIQSAKKYPTTSKSITISLPKPSIAAFPYLHPDPYYRPFIEGHTNKTINDAMEEGNDRARLGMEMYGYRIKKYIGAYSAAMGGIDILIFTGGIGENDYLVRKYATDGLEYLGIEIDHAKNDHLRKVETHIHSENSRVKVLITPTNEELVIAKDTMNIVSNQ